MRLFRRRKRSVTTGKSPFDADRIGPGDPGWDVMMTAMRSGNPVVGIYDSETGEVVSITEVPPAASDG